MSAEAGSALAASSARASPLAPLRQLEGTAALCVAVTSFSGFLGLRGWLPGAPMLSGGVLPLWIHVGWCADALWYMLLLDSVSPVSASMGVYRCSSFDSIRGFDTSGAGSSGLPA